LFISETGDEVGFRQQLSTTSFKAFEREITVNYPVYTWTENDSLMPNLMSWSIFSWLVLLTEHKILHCYAPNAVHSTAIWLPNNCTRLADCRCFQVSNPCRAIHSTCSLRAPYCFDRYRFSIKIASSCEIFIILLNFFLLIFRSWGEKIKTSVNTLGPILLVISRTGTKISMVYIIDIYHSYFRDSIMISSRENIMIFLIFSIFFIFSKYQPLLLLFTYFSNSCISNITKACCHAITQNARLRSWWAKELSARLKFDVCIQTSREDRCSTSRNLLECQWINASAAVSIPTPPQHWNGTAEVIVGCIWSNWLPASCTVKIIES